MLIGFPIPEVTSRTGIRPTTISVAAGLFVIILSALSNPAQARTDKKCLDSQVVPEISFRIKNSKVTLNRSKSSAQIKRFASRVNAYKPTIKGRLLGLAYTEVQRRLGVHIGDTRIGENKPCIRLQKVQFEFGLTKSEIFIDRKYKPGTCAYNAILAHEREHMQINNRLMEKYAVKIEEDLVKHAKAVRPFYASNSKQATKSIVNDLLHRLKPRINEFKKERAVANQKIDTPRSYKKVRSRCANW